MNSKWLSPKGIQEHYSFPRTTAYRLLKEYEDSGGEVIKIGTAKRVNEEQFTEWLLRGKHE
jgi:hypothetical protein